MRLLFFLLLPFMWYSCNSLKKLQRAEGFSDECYEAYRFFEKNLLRAEDGLFEFVKPVDVIYSQAFELYINRTDCWLSTLPENAVRRIFGEPHIRKIADKKEVIILEYYIRTKTCLSANDINSYQDQCGILRFRFFKDGTPAGKGVFYAFQPTSSKI